MGERKKVIIDLLREEDNGAILDLSHRCIQHGVMSVYPDRTPVFNRIHKEIDPGAFHLVARKGDKLIGCFGGIYTPVQHEGKVYNSLYMLDFKVDPDHQKSMTAYRLVKEIYERTFGQGQEMGFASIIKGNVASRIFTEGRAGFPPSNYLGDIHFNNSIPLLKKRVDKRYVIEHPVEEDIVELVDLYTRFYETYKLAPFISEELFRYYLDKIEGIDLENMWVAREKGKIKAVLCAWDENIYKRMKVMTIPRGMKVALSVIRFLSGFMKMPATMRPGDALRQRTLVMMAHDQNIEALKNLVRHVYNIHRGTEYSVLQTHFHEEDPMRQVLKGMFGLKVEIEIHMLTGDPALGKKIEETSGPVLFEWPMFI